MPQADEPDRISSSRRNLLVLAGGGASLALAGCLGDDDGGEDPTETETETDPGDETPTETDTDTPSGPPTGGTFNLVNSTVTSLDPIQSDDTASASVLGQAYENLVDYIDGWPEITNQLAAEVDVNENFDGITFTLKEGVTYHNGDTMSAADVVYSIRRLAESPNSVRANFVLEPISGLNMEREEDSEGNLVPGTIGVEAVDDQTVEFSMQTPNPDALDIIAYDSFAIMPEGTVGDVEGYEGEYSQSEIANDTMVGTGPFEHDFWEPNSEAQVTAFDDYHGEGPYIDAVHWRILEDDEASWTYAMEQNADMFGVPTAYYDRDLIDAEADENNHMVGTYGPLENGETADYQSFESLTTYYFAFNAAQTPKPVRQAIAHLLNHQELVSVIFADRGSEAFSFTPPGIWPTGTDGYNEFVDNWPYGMNETDREGAAQVLEDAGYTEDNPFELTLTTYDSVVFQEAGRLLRDKTSGLGINMTLEESPFAVLQSSGENGNMQMYSLGWAWSWGSAAYGHFGFEPENTITPFSETGNNGYYLDWGADDASEDHAGDAQDAWETIVNNPGPDAGDTRAQAHVDIERYVRDDMVMLNLFHPITERFKYQYVDIPQLGVMGGHRQMYNRVRLEDQ